MIVVNHLLKGSHAHRRTAQIINLGSLLLGLLLLGLQALLILNELLLLFLIPELLFSLTVSSFSPPPPPPPSSCFYLRSVFFLSSVPHFHTGTCFFFFDLLNIALPRLHASSARHTYKYIHIHTNTYTDILKSQRYRKFIQ